MNSIPQISTNVNKHVNSRIEALALADDCLDQANQFRAAFLRSGDARAWQMARACLEDREMLLGEVQSWEWI